jgi:hypothetical protein
MESPHFRCKHLRLCMISVLPAFLIGGCGGESRAPAPISGQSKGWSEGERHRSGSQSPRIKSSNIKTH